MVQRNTLLDLSTVASHSEKTRAGYYLLFAINFSASLLKVGTNTITFTATNVSSGGGVMYDAIKLETD